MCTRWSPSFPLSNLSSPFSTALHTPKQSSILEPLYPSAGSRYSPPLFHLSSPTPRTFYHAQALSLHWPRASVTYLAPSLHDTLSPRPSSSAPLGFQGFTSSQSPLASPNSIAPRGSPTHTHAMHLLPFLPAPGIPLMRPPSPLLPGTPLYPHPRNLTNLLAFKIPSGVS